MAITGANDKKAWQDVRTETGEVVEKLKILKIGFELNGKMVTWE